MQKRIKIISIVVLLLVSMMVISSCVGVSNEKIEFEEYGDFIYYKITDDDVVICDVTESAYQKEILVFPEFINGLKVDSIVNDRFRSRNFSKLTARKIYLPDVGYYAGSYIFDHEGLETIVFNGKHTLLDSQFVSKNSGVDIIRIPGIDFIIISYCSVYEANVVFKNNYVEYHTEDEIRQKAETIKNYPQEQIDVIMENFRNEEISVHNGVVWIDYLQEGETLTLLPPIPQREGYIFDGWFEESECINEINLTEIRKGSEDLIYYAKWIKE